MNETTLRELLADVAVPGEAAAKERVGRRVAGELRPRPRRRRTALRRLGPVVAMLVLGLAASALASAGPGSAVSRWVRALVDSPPSRPLGELPTGGRLLATGAGGAWLVDADGDRHRLGDFDEASWSPRGLFVAAAGGRTLSAVDPTGSVHWTVGSETAVRSPRWSPDGYRVSYRAGSTLRVVAGDGSGDRSVASAVADVAPAWRPDASHTLAFVAKGGDLVRIDADSGKRRVLARGLTAATWVGWSGRRRVLAATNRTLVMTTTGGRRRQVAAPRGSTIVTAAMSPSGGRVALLLRHRAGWEVVLADARTLELTRSVIAVSSAARDLVWSPDQRWLAVSLPRRGRWLLAPVTRRGRAQAVTGLAAAFGAPAREARPLGWCCAPALPRG